jgi:hypothetical protein
VPATSSGPVSALSACLAAKCENQCGLTCGAFAGYLSEPATAGACETCLEQNGCSDERTCGTSADCDALWRCIRACPTIDCKQACPHDHATGFAESANLFNDFSGLCMLPCGFGNYWECAGHIDYPVAKAPVTTWTNYVYDISDRLAVPNATLLVCANCPCPTAEFPLLAQGTSNLQGYVTIPIPLKQASNGQAEPFCIQVSAPGLDNTFFFPGIPYSEPSISINDALGPPVSLGMVLFSADNIKKVIGSLGGTYDPARGMIAAGIFDCLANPSNQVVVQIDSNDPLAVLAQPFDAGAEAGLATLSGGINTNGHAVFFNLAPRTYVITATPAGFSKPVGQTTVNVAATTVSQCGVFPGP